MSVFDRYLMRRFFHVFLVAFVCSFGLFVVIDAFTNIDGFQEHAGGDYVLLLSSMGYYYGYQLFPFFDMVAPILMIIAAMTTFALLVRHSELQPILSAGVPTYRLVVPVLVAAFLVDIALVANQEFVLPNIADRLQTPRGKLKPAPQRVEPVYDYSTGIAIYGQKLFPEQEKVEHMSIALPVPEVVKDLTTLRAPVAVYIYGTAKRPSGWLLKQVRPSYSEIPLTKLGKQLVLPGSKPDELFVVSDVDTHQLHRSNMSYRLLSTTELFRRIQSPALGTASVRSLSVHFHERLVRPLLNLLVVLVTLPFVIRKGSSSLITDLVVCCSVLGGLFAFAEASLYLGQAALLSPELAAWLPVIFTGGLCTWSAALVQT